MKNLKLSVLLMLFVLVSCSKDDDSGSSSIKGSGSYDIYMSIDKDIEVEIPWWEIFDSENDAIMGMSATLVKNGPYQISWENGSGRWVYITRTSAEDDCVYFLADTEEADVIFTLRVLVLDRETDEVVLEQEYSGKSKYQVKFNL